MARKITPYQIERAEDRSDDLKRQYLRENGWTYHCDNPGGLWLWEKKFNHRDYRKKYICDTDSAYYIESHYQDLMR